MKKWMLRAPRMLDGMRSPSFGSGVGLMVLIALAIYIAYQNASVIGVIGYGVFFALGGDFGSFLDMLKAIVSTQGIILFSLFFTVVLTLFTVVYLRRIEKRPLIAVGISRGRIAQRYAAGFALGAAALLLCSSPSFFTEDLTYKGVSAFIPVYLLAFIVQSSSEEVFFRGFLMTAIAKRTGIIYAVLISSAFFSLAHAPNGGYSLLTCIYYTLIGAFLALLMLRTNSIWASCGFHAAWNFTIGLLVPMKLGSGLPQVDYALFDAGETGGDISFGIIGDPSYLILIGVFAIAVAILLFAGGNRLIARAPQPRPMGAPASESAVQ
jgi:CAAX amino terminal protease family.